MSEIKIEKISITDIGTDAVVNAANSGLRQGGGVCGALFAAAGAKELTKACNEIGGCPTGGAVITPGFRLPAKYIIHAVGPIWSGGRSNEPQLLYDAYMSALERARENSCNSIAFPLISAGIYGYPVDQAWERALTACSDFIEDNPDYDIKIYFAVLNDEIMRLGQALLLSGALA